MLRILHGDYDSCEEMFEFHIMAPLYWWQQASMKYVVKIVIEPIESYKRRDLMFEAFNGDEQILEEVKTALEQLAFEYADTKVDRVKRMFNQLLPQGYMQVAILKCSKEQLIMDIQKITDSDEREWKDFKYSVEDYLEESYENE